jgi:hypothetical protein
MAADRRTAIEAGDWRVGSSVNRSGAKKSAMDQVAA